MMLIKGVPPCCAHYLSLQFFLFPPPLPTHTHPLVLRPVIPPPHAEKLRCATEIHGTKMMLLMQEKNRF